jgi:hypothetical protein
MGEHRFNKIRLLLLLSCYQLQSQLIIIIIIIIIFIIISPQLLSLILEYIKLVEIHIN